MRQASLLKFDDVRVRDDPTQVMVDREVAQQRSELLPKDSGDEVGPIVRQFTRAKIGLDFRPARTGSHGDERIRPAISCHQCHGIQIALMQVPGPTMEGRRQIHGLANLGGAPADSP